MVAVTAIPGVRVLGCQPSRAKPLEPLISIAHCSGRPSLSTVSTIHACGLVHWNSLTVPRSVTSRLESNLAKAWWAFTEVMGTATMMPASASSLAFIIVTREVLNGLNLLGVGGHARALCH